MKKAPRLNGAKQYGVYAVKEGSLIRLELKGEQGGIAVGLTLEQAYAVAKVLNALGDELASELVPEAVEG